MRGPATGQTRAFRGPSPRWRFTVADPEGMLTRTLMGLAGEALLALATVAWLRSRTIARAWHNDAAPPPPAGLSAGTPIPLQDPAAPKARQEDGSSHEQLSEQRHGRRSRGPGKAGAGDCRPGRYRSCKLTNAGRCFQYRSVDTNVSRN